MFTARQFIKFMFLLLIIVSMFRFVVQNAHADGNSAMKLCMAIQMSGVLIEPCEIDGANKRIVTQISGGKHLAATMCKNMKKTTIVYESYFDKGWVIHIMNFPNVEKRLAMCHLPTTS